MRCPLLVRASNHWNHEQAQGGGTRDHREDSADPEHAKQRWHGRGQRGATDYGCRVKYGEVSVGLLGGRQKPDTDHSETTPDTGRRPVARVTSGTRNTGQ